jgi:hypothetical protein
MPHLQAPEAPLSLKINLFFVKNLTLTKRWKAQACAFHYFKKKIIKNKGFLTLDIPKFI